MSRLVIRVCFGLLGFVAGLFLLEAVLRVGWVNPYAGERQDRFLELPVNPALRNITVDRRSIYPDSPVGRVRTDERSYLLPHRLFESPDATIVFLGGSTTQCNAVTEELRFPVLVSDLLAERGLRVNTLNVARAGNNVHDSLEVLLNHVVDDEPDAVVLMHAANDIGILTFAGSYRPGNPAPLSPLLVGKWLLQGSSSRSAVAGGLRWWVTSRFRALEVRDFAARANLERERADVPTEPFTRRLRAFVGLARGFDIEPILMTQPAISLQHELRPSWIDAYNQEIFNDEIRRVARESEVILIDLARYLATQVPGWDQPMKVFYDGIHVTDEGSQIYAEHIAAQLLETLLRPKAR